MRRLIPLLVLLALACGSPAHAPTLPDRDDKEFIGSLVEKTAQVRVTCVAFVADSPPTEPAPPSADGVTEETLYGFRVRKWSGSGVWVGAHGLGHVLATAAHVADTSDETGQCFISVDDATGFVLKQDDVADVALVWFPVKGKGSLEQSETYLGMPVVAVGFPLQLLEGKTGLQVTRGVIAAYHESKDRYRVTASFFKGSSGGPLFDEQGRLVGLTVSGIMLYGQLPIDDQYFVTPASHVFRMYEEVINASGDSD